MRHHSLHSQKCVWLFCAHNVARKLTSLLLVAALSFASLPAVGVALPGHRSAVLVRDTALLRALMLQSGGTAVTPILECVVRRHGNYTAARFGYNSDNLSSVSIPIGTRNAFSPAPADRSQTTTFLSGRQYSVFDVAFDGTPLSWSLTGPDNITRTATATSNSYECEDEDRPVANAGPNQTVAIGATVHLTGAGSTDEDGDALTYHWSFFSIPAGSTAVLSGANTATPTFVADKPGSYLVQLIVNDGELNSQPATVTISTQNSAPVANAGENQTVQTGRGEDEKK